MERISGQFLRYIYRIVKRKLIKWLRIYFRNNRKYQPRKLNTKLENKSFTDADYEYYFMQLLEGVEHGWRRNQVERVFEALTEHTTAAEWITWLHNFGEKLLVSPKSNHELATRMVHLGELGCGEFGQIAHQIGIKLLSHPLELSPENNAVLDGADPQEAQVFFRQGIQLFNLEDFPGAIANYDKALAILPNAHELWYNRANALFKSGQIENAIASYDKAVEYKPDKSEAWNNRGNALFKIGFIEDAIASYDKALAIQPNYQQAWYNQGVALGHAGRLEEALAAYDKALAIESRDYQVWFNRGLVLGNLGRLEEAAISWDKVIELKPDHYEAWYNRSVALNNLGRSAEAVTSWHKAQSLNSN